MKALHVVVLVVALCVATAGFAQQQPTLVWEQQFTFGGQYDVPATVLQTPTGVYINGWYESASITKSALSAFNTVGTQQWITRDSVPSTWSFSGQLALVLADNAVVWFSGNSQGYNPSWIVKTEASTGNELWRVPVNRLMFLGNYTDTSFVAVLSGENPIAFIYTRDGAIAKQFPLASGRVEGYVSIRTSENSLWIGFQFPGGVAGSSSYAVERYDLSSGQRTWRRELIDVSLGQMEFSEGAIYAGGTKLVNEAAGLLKFSLAKIEIDGGLTWQREWFGRNTFRANYDNFSQDIAVVGTGGSKQVLLLGSIERSDTGNTSQKNSYLIARRASNGDFLWTIEGSRGILANFRDAVGSGNGEFFLIEHVFASNGSYGTLYKFLAPTLSVKELPGLPESFSLSQNYPNPFNPSTTIRFELLSRTPVRLTVHNTLGQEITTLVNETLQSGVYETTWDARGVASGTYFYRLTSDQLVQTKKMVLLK